jgi:hypothetical protein
VQAAVVADAAAVAPATAGRLIEQAGQAGVRELRDECARVKAAADPDADARYERIRRERSVRTYTDAEGAWNLHARGPAHEGAAFQAALDALTDLRFRQAYRDGELEPRTAYAFDALVTLAPHTGAASRNVKYRALLRVDIAALVRGHVDGEECCEVAGVGPVPVRVARGVLGDSLLHLIITRGRDVATVVHLGRRPSAAQHIALLWSQPTCSRQGCDQTWTHTEIDHRTQGAHTHATQLHDLDRLCRHDHRLKTHHGWPSPSAAASDPWSRPTTPTILTSRTLQTTQPGRHDHATHLAAPAHSAHPPTRVGSI